MHIPGIILHHFIIWFGKPISGSSISETVIYDKLKLKLFFYSKFQRYSIDDGNKEPQKR
jgi:hypothetical protein